MNIKQMLKGIDKTENEETVSIKLINHYDTEMNTRNSGQENSNLCLRFTWHSCQ